MRHITSLGKYLFAIPLIIYGFLHLIKAQVLTVSMSLPGGIIWTYLIGLTMLLAGVAILIGRKDSVAAFLLGVLLLIYALVVHLPNLIDTNFADPVHAGNLLKDIAIAGAALVYSKSAARDRTTWLT